MDYLTIPKWDNFQHYGKRNPPWIKVYKDLLLDRDFTNSLSDSQKAQVVCLWLVASTCENRIPLDTKWLKRVTGLSRLCIDDLLCTKWLAIYDASNLLEQEEKSRDRDRDRVETEERREEKTPTTSNDQIIMQSWNELAKQHNLPTVRTMTKKRITTLKARMKENPQYLADFGEAVNQIPSRPFLMGKNDRKWTADIDWILQPDSVTKILEGKYTDRDSKPEPEIIQENGKQCNWGIKR